MSSFGVRLASKVAERGSLVVGIDPHPGLLAAWGLPDSARGVAEFSRIVVESLADLVPMVKPQSALYERHGSQGVAALEDTLSLARELGVLSLVDAKRGDIGSTMTAYAEAYLGPMSSLAGDAVTLSPYLGFGSLQPALEMAADNERGVFVLALTSNPEGASVQHATGPEGRSVAATIARDVAEANADARRRGELGSVGMVVGATVGDAVRKLGIDLAETAAPLLAPGVGAQGAGPDELRAVFGLSASNGQLLPTTSRAILAHGPDPAALRQAVFDAVAELDSLTD
ncbi:orotidine-5'-phosphate decarboxylase [Saxibacter everestensis]|uniref:Orotidine 5'-phosphate decarboxylase n=1 Tax=Saxibacter everestensis TaxID=2909229 RepID=A0ABY8QXW2_9MICO|nr:orotidine-5'-phosphate decarboxylase [Brevibacteriaceae bacterium ZFBP1038]